MGRWRDMMGAGQPLRRIALDAGMHALAELADQLPQMRQRMNGCRLIEDVAYGREDGVELRLDILQPLRAGLHPVLIYLHGGAFAIGSKRTHRALAAAYAARGYLVCNVDYRLAPQYPFPAALADTCAAWLWAADQIGVYGGDPRRMALAGESAGANLALALTLACCTPRPEPFAAAVFQRGLRPVAALLYCGFLQVSAAQRFRQSGASAVAAHIATGAARSDLGPLAAQGGPAQALADPLCLVEAMAVAPGLPPLFIAAGLNDTVLSDSERLEQALRRLHASVAAHYYPGQGHGFHVLFWREQAQRCWRDSFGFLQQYLPVHTPEN